MISYLQLVRNLLVLYSSVYC